MSKADAQTEEHGDDKSQRPRLGGIKRWWNNIPLAGKGVAVVAVPLASLVCSLIAFSLASSIEQQQQEQVRRSLEVQTQIRKVLANAVDSETGVRGYLLTGRDDFLEPYRDGSQALPENIRVLANLLDDDPLQTRPMQRLTELLTQRLLILDRGLKEIAPQTGTLTAEQQALVREGKTVMDQIRSSMRTIENGAQGLLSSRMARLQTADTLLEWIFAASSIAGILGGAFSMWVFSRSVARRIGLLQANATRLADGLPLVPAGHNGHDEIGHLSMGLEKSAALLAERNQSLQAEREQLAAIVAAQQEIAAANGDLNSTLRLILHYAESLLGGHGAGLSFVEGDHLVVRIGVGISAALVGMVVKPKTSFSALCAKTGEVLRCDDSETDDRVDRAASRTLGVRSVLVAPFRADGPVLGALSVVSTELHKFTERDVSTIQLMASLVGVAILRDRGQQTLRVSEERFRQLSQSVRDVFWIISADKGELVYANRAYAQTWGSAADRVLGKPWKWAEAIHPEDRDRVLRNFREKATIGDYSDEFRVVW
ncbi:MAG: CHASE3 domain-containing protein, partial [Verrucomicrobiota bacterium]|nr:CHASE3 domain-containing protein [Verrucomicrobiota bacterium]